MLNPSLLAPVVSDSLVGQGSSSQCVGLFEVAAIFSAVGHQSAVQCSEPAALSVKCVTLFFFL